MPHNIREALADYREKSFCRKPEKLVAASGLLRAISGLKETMDDFSISALVWTAVSVFLIGVSKGGIPVGPIALPLLILAWPGGTEPAKTAVAFMLPLLCVMDIFAVAFFRRHIDWKRLVPLLPGSVAGIVLGSIFFVSRDSAWLSLPDRGIKLCIGLVGLGFVFYQAAKKFILKKVMITGVVPGMFKGTAYGFSAGLVSTLAHASGPIMQMYLLPQGLPKMEFAGTTAVYFFIKHYSSEWKKIILPATFIKH